MSIMELFGPLFTMICCSGETRNDLGLLDSGEVSIMDGCRELSGLLLFCIPAFAFRWFGSRNCGPKPKSSREPFLFIRLSKLFVRERFAFINIVLPTPTFKY